jgi:hypothetical protein
MQVDRISENPVLVGGDYKRACLFFDEVVPVIWPSDESEDDPALFLNQYGEYRDALDAPFLKKRLLGSQWRGWIEGYAHLALGRLAFLKMRRDFPEATNIWQLAQVTLDYLREGMPGVDQGYVSIFFPDADTLWRRVVVNPLGAVVDALGENRITVDIYGHPGLESTDDTVDVMLANIRVVQCDGLTWEHIGEIRGDVVATQELRQLRRFMLREMKGYTKSHVEDELLKAIEDHNKAAKKWGITTLPSSIKVDCEASIVSGLLMGAASIAAGVALPVSMAVGTLVVLGQALITIRKGRKSFIRNSNVRYLVRLQNEAKNIP